MLDASNRKLLIRLARQSLQHGTDTSNPLSVNASDYATELQEHRATFVTLKSLEKLRGCIGTLEATRPLVDDVAYNAFAAGFRDPRFPALTDSELPGLTISVSILQPAVKMQFKNEADLIQQLEPGKDGLIMGYQRKRGTFLPAVWEDLSDPVEFIQHLKMKAGLTPTFWSDDIWVQRYTTESFSD